MRPRITPRRRRRGAFHPAVASGATAVALYSWWATGVRPFSDRSSIAVGVPAVVLTLLAVGARRVGRGGSAGRPEECRPLLGTAGPWVVWLVISAGLESVALALGGRSTTVPTISTVIDHALAWHGLRWILFVAWLVAGGAGAVRAAYRRHPQAT